MLRHLNALTLPVWGRPLSQMQIACSDPKPTIHRRRPTDATSLFWAVAGGFFFALEFGFCIGPYVWPGVILILILGFYRQLGRWRRNSRVLRQATDWCGTYYPSYGKYPVVDLMVSLADDNTVDFETMTPTTTLEAVNRLPNGRKLNDNFSEMMIAVLRRARIRKVNGAKFAGATLDEAVQFLARELDATN